jgi:hypothetical protein
MAHEGFTDFRPMNLFLPRKYSALTEDMTEKQNQDKHPVSILRISQIQLVELTHLLKFRFLKCLYLKFTKSLYDNKIGLFKTG